MEFPKAALRAVIEYMWDDELEHYEKSGSPGHIFEELNELRLWLDSQSRESEGDLDQPEPAA